MPGGWFPNPSNSSSTLLPFHVRCLGPYFTFALHSTQHRSLFYRIERRRAIWFPKGLLHRDRHILAQHLAVSGRVAFANDQREMLLRRLGELEGHAVLADGTDGEADGNQLDVAFLPTRTYSGVTSE